MSAPTERICTAQVTAQLEVRILSSGVYSLAPAIDKQIKRRESVWMRGLKKCLVHLRNYQLFLVAIVEVPPPVKGMVKGIG